MPELELGQPPDEWSELLILLRGQRAASVAVFEPLVLRERGVEFRLQEGEEEVQEVDSEGVGNDVPALGYDDSEEEEEEEAGGADPSVGDVGGGGVEVGLVVL